MKLLVCTDGSKQSMKAVEQAIAIAKGCSVNEVAVIHVCENRVDWASLPSEEGTITTEDMERIKNYINQCDSEKSNEVLLEAGEAFKKNNIEAKTIFKEGHPAHTISEVANDEEYDMVVIGSRGLGGLKKLFLGSVSSAVIQEVKCNVLVVK